MQVRDLEHSREADNIHTNSSARYWKGQEKSLPQCWQSKSNSTTRSETGHIEAVNEPKNQEQMVTTKVVHCNYRSSRLRRGNICQVKGQTLPQCKR